MHNMEKSSELNPPHPRRLKRISIFQTTIGSGHKRILEMGCGSGDLTNALVKHADLIIGIDISRGNLKHANSRKRALTVKSQDLETVQFAQMSAVHVGFRAETFDYAVSTSMVEHLRPEDVPLHFREVWRVLKPGGRYLVWCPNRLGHHKDRDFHLSMYSYREWIDEMTTAGFREFRSYLFNSPPMVSAFWKVYLEEMLSKLGIKILWSHLGVRNVLVMGSKKNA